MVKTKLIIKRCLICKKEFNVIQSRYLAKYCSTMCYGISKNGKIASDITKIKISKALKGRKFSDEHRLKIRKKAIDRKHSEETKRKMSISRRGNTNGRGSKGKKKSEETKIKMSRGQLIRYKKNGLSEKQLKHIEKFIELGKNRIGNKHPNWKGGISQELYGSSWNKSLRHSIRVRDKFICNICKKNGWCVHHIDYNKQNNHSDNLITLCNSCHMKTNFNRKYWISFFKK